MQPVIVYSANKSSRLEYVLNWLFTERLKIAYRLVQNANEIAGSDIAFAYGVQLPGTISIPDAGLLWEKEITQQDIAVGTWQELPTLFAAAENNYTLTFDIFSSIFFLLSRYEEYYTYTPDKYSRYPATESILYKNRLLRRPLIDEWMHQLRGLIKKDFSARLPETEFTFQPTYDIDIAWSYLHKGTIRNAGGLAKDILTGNFLAAAQRVKVLSNTGKDPYDSFPYLSQLHKDHSYTPIYFVLAALQNTSYDKNILPSHPAMQSLLQQLSHEGKIGMHPSFYTDTNTQAWRDEKTTLEQISGQSINASRQHYIKMSLPATYRFLEENNIADDHSMGYGTHLGFRAGTGQPFCWYDIEREKSSSLIIHPFCFMDSTARYEEHLSAHEAFAVLNEMAQKLQQTNSRLITVFHNFSLGTEAGWKGWNVNYARFLERMA